MVVVGAEETVEVRLLLEYIEYGSDVTSKEGATCTGDDDELTEKLYLENDNGSSNEP